MPKVTQLAFNHKFVLLQSLLFSPHPATPPSCALNGIVYLQVLCQVVTRQILFIHLLEPKQTVILGSIPFCLSGEPIRCTHCTDPAYLSRLALAGMEVAVREKQLRFPSLIFPAGANRATISLDSKDLSHRLGSYAHHHFTIRFSSH